MNMAGNRQYTITKQILAVCRGGGVAVASPQSQFLLGTLTLRQFVDLTRTDDACLLTDWDRRQRQLPATKLCQVEIVYLVDPGYNRPWNDL